MPSSRNDRAPQPNPSTSDECIRAAWAALMQGDTKERDRLCHRAGTLLDAEDHAAAVGRVLAKDFYVTAHGICIPVGMMARAAGAIQ